MTDAPDALTMGFVRGISPSRWADRWNAVRRRRRMNLVPVDAHFDAQPAGVDLTLVRAMPGAFPADSRDGSRSRHAVQLYEEAVALVVDADHDLSDVRTIDAVDLDLVRLLDHPAHDVAWPEPEPWKDPTWKPTSLPGALELVATGLGGILMPLPLARHIGKKREHKIVEITGEIAGTRVFATWDVKRDDDEIQELIGVLRGRSARSSR